MNNYIIERKDGTSKEVGADYYNIVNDVYFFYVNKKSRENEAYCRYSLHSSFVISVKEDYKNNKPFKILDINSINKQVTKLQADLEKLRGLSTRDIADYLTLLTKFDKPAMAAMLANRVPCNSDLANSKDTMAVEQHGGYYTSLIDILNGMLLANGQNDTIGYVFKNGNLSHFEVN